MHATSPAAVTLAQTQPMRARVILASILGNALEWYDFTVYAFLATIISRHFFPNSTPTVALLSTFAVFGVGFVARPVGGLLIGIYGDAKGRKPALLLTIGLMAAGTCLIGLLPTYATIGIGAPVLLVIARILQGFSAGGEWGGSASYLVEWAPSRHRGLYGSFHPGSIFLGQMVGTAVTALLSSGLGPELMANWGWRIPFLLGAIVGPLGVIARNKIGETPVFERAAEAETPVDATTRLPIRKMMFAFAFVAVQSVAIYIYLSYFPTFLQHYVGWSAGRALWSTAIATVATGVAVVTSGALSDLIGRRPVLLTSCIFFLLFSYPLVWVILHSHNFALCAFIQALLSANCGLFIGSMAAALVEMFPTRRRLTGLSTAYNLASMIFGGFAPFIATWLIASTGAPISVTYYVILGAAVSLPAVIAFRETAWKPLD
ncbi:MFS transporter [Paraburkholderia sp.]|jgi:MHS family proline/betaine transporter-like MFS transporter|uniref:MFS transporter n=1 Tax=Paraburkholderia sp. TaxID=1926495 RepID=UPI002F4299E3